MFYISTNGSLQMDLFLQFALTSGYGLIRCNWIFWECILKQSSCL